MNNFVSKFNVGGTEILIKDSHANNEITKINNKLEYLLSNDAIIISDSYGVESVVGQNSWVNGLKKAIINKYNSTVYTSTHGSRGFVADNIVAENFLDSLKEFDYLSTEDKNKIKYIIVCGGANDSNKSVDTIFSYMKIFMQYVNKNYPNASCYVGMIAYSSRNTDNMFFNSLPAYQKISELPKGVYLNGSENILRKPFLQDDGLHPNNNGCNELTRYLTNAFFTGKCDVIRNNTNITITPSGAATSYSGIGGITENQFNDTSTLSLRSNSSNNTMTINVNKSTFKDLSPVEIGTINGTLSYYSTIAHGFFSGQCYFRGGQYNAPIEGSNMGFTAYVGGDKLYFKPYGIAVSNNFWGTPITNVKAIEISDIILAIGNSFFVQ